MEQMKAGVPHEVALKEYVEARDRRIALQASSASSSSASSSAAPTAPGPKVTAKAPRSMPDKTIGEKMAELDRARAQGLQVTVSSLPPATVSSLPPPATESSLHPPIVRKTVSLQLTSAEEKAWDDEQAAAKAARAEKRAAANGKMMKPAEDAPTAEWVAWENQQALARVEATTMS